MVVIFHLECRNWGCNKWGFKGRLAVSPGNRPKSAFFSLFLPFPPFSGGCEEQLENPISEEKGLFPQMSSDLLKPPSLESPSAALQFMIIYDDFPGSSLKNGLTSLNKDVRTFFLSDDSIFGVFPLFLLLAITVFGGPEGYASLAIIAFGALQFIVPECYYRIGKMEFKESSLLI